MKVFVVMEADHGFGGGVAGVFSTLELAQSFIDQRGTHDFWIEGEMEVDSEVI